eukprot:NODE_45_length_32908_cov_0.790271.p8 type:complete len:375 gc:universal NODE_45_length_32908_cov_0.790271:12988-11864(-)
MTQMQNTQLQKLNDIASQHYPNTKVQSMKPFGNSLISTKSLKIGEIVLNEQPALIAKNGDIVESFFNMIQKYPSKIGLIDAFKTMDLQESNKFAKIKECVDALNHATDYKDHDLASRYATMWVLNAHGINNSDDNALYVFASKANHSCSQNVCNVGWEQGQLTFKAIKPINASDEITFSYISGDLLIKPRRFRMEKLLHDRGFVCLCARCRGIDDMRMIKCQCGLTVIPSKNQLICACQMNLNHLLEIEKKLEDKVMDLDMNPFKATINILNELRDQVLSHLGDLHWTYLTLNRLIYDLCPTQKTCDDIIIWLYTYLYPIQPFNAAQMAFEILDLEMELSDEMKQIISELLVFIEIGFGKEDQRVTEWSQINGN